MPIDPCDPASDDSATGDGTRGDSDAGDATSPQPPSAPQVPSDVAHPAWTRPTIPAANAGLPAPTTPAAPAANAGLVSPTPYAVPYPTGAGIGFAPYLAPPVSPEVRGWRRVGTGMTLLWIGAWCGAVGMALLAIALVLVGGPIDPGRVIVMAFFGLVGGLGYVAWFILTLVSMIFCAFVPKNSGLRSIVVMALILLGGMFVLSIASGVAEMLYEQAHGLQPTPSQPLDFSTLGKVYSPVARAIGVLSGLVGVASTAAFFWFARGVARRFGEDGIATGFGVALAVSVVAGIVWSFTATDATPALLQSIANPSTGASIPSEVFVTFAGQAVTVIIVLVLSRQLRDAIRANDPMATGSVTHPAYGYATGSMPMTYPASTNPPEVPPPNAPLSHGTPDPSAGPSDTNLAP